MLLLSLISSFAHANTPINDTAEPPVIAGPHALDFDASDDYINVPFITPSPAMTIEAWIEITSADQNLRTVISWSDGDGSHYFQIRSWSHFIYFEEVGGNGFVQRASFVPGGDGAHHIAVVKTAASTNNMLLYIDGVLSGPDRTGGSFTGLDEVNIGALKRFNSYSNYYMGELDEIRVWNYDRCLEEIMAQKDCELTGNEPGLELYYNFNQGTAAGDNTGETALDDLSPNNNNGTFNNFTLDGATSNFITAANSVSGACTAAPLSEINVTGMSMNIASGDDLPDVLDGTDFGITPINTPTTNTFKIKNLGAADLEITAITLSNSTQFSLPMGLSLPLTITPATSFDLDITFQAATAGLFESDLTITNDDCNEASYTFALLGKDAPIDEDMMHFDGTDDYIDVPYFALDFSSMAVEGWVYFDVNDFNSRTVVGWSGSDGSYAYSYMRGSTLYWEENDTNSSGSSSAFSISSGWHHIAFVKKPSPTDNLLIYIDGDLERTSTSNTNLTTLDALTLCARQSNGNYSQYYSNAMDEIRIWNYDRCEEEILAQKDCELLGTEVGLQLYYDFNEGLTAGDNTALTSVTDGSPNSNNGTLNNFTLDGMTSNFIGATNGVRGACMSLALAEINVTGLGMNINSGDDSPSTADGTDYGIITSGNSAMQTFTIENTGTADLNITDIQLDNPAQFTFPAQTFPLVIAPNMDFDLVVTYTPQFAGTNTTTVTISNDDCSESEYTFTLSGADCSGAYQIKSIINRFCPGETNGSIDLTITPAGGDPNYSVAWSNMETTEDLMNLSAGTYTVSVTEMAGQSCQVTKSFDIYEHLAPDLSAATLSANDVCNVDNVQLTIDQLPWQNFDLDPITGLAAFIEEVVDLNNDQLMDYVYSDNNELYWVPNASGNNFGTAQLIDDDYNNNSFSAGRVESGDMNGDNKPDLIGKNSYGQVVWYENDGSGIFTKHTITSTGFAPSPIIVDVDGQNGLDIMLGDGIANGSEVAWLQNDGSGNFTGIDILSATSPRSSQLFPIDYDRDGDMDFLYNHSIDNNGTETENLTLLINDGSQNFTTQIINTEVVDQFESYVYYGALIIQDIDQDGWEDIVFYQEEPISSFSSRYIVYWLKNVNGTFATKQELYRNGSIMRDIKFADWDADGQEDIFVGIGGRLVVLKKTGATTYQEVVNHPSSGASFLDLHVKDIDQDGGFEVFVNQIFAQAGASFFELLYLEDIAVLENPFDLTYNINSGSDQLLEDQNRSFANAYPQIMNLTDAGTITVNITEIVPATGCPVTTNLTTDFNRIAFDVTSAITPMDECAVNNDGAIDITATVTGSTETLTYQWFDPQTSTTDEDRTGLSDGSYRVRVGAGNCFNFSNHAVGDVEAPTAKAKDYTVGLNGAMDVTVSGADIDDTSTDNCSIATYECMLPNGDPCTFANTGDYDVVLKVTDDAGLENTATATVTVEASSLAIDARSFTAQVIEQESHLQWSVISSVDLSHFVVEHSVDAKNWQAIGEVVVSTENNNQKTYQFVDTNPSKGINYYRIQEVTLAGKTSYSTIKKLWLETANAALRVFPNPTSGELTITATNLSETSTVITVFDLVGKVIYQQQLVPTAAFQQTIQLNNLPQGIYTIQLENAGQVRTNRVIKQ
ncbi:MAG: LamG-like jellyroll fold domain-containing protein [Saprospiraceae bacterium]